ncbi:radical SAM protein [Emticicia sp. BO119]|uniref:SPL family radical SAM protein n=1 Tax=Emticicia sp. BO119 TaxID=2757768 RepID=UPI0015F0C41F|nr:radical SAM protein [Emticicia sp. BO119]MBA4851980.1 radical SAM protein [Emticicia sp. BO119]
MKSAQLELFELFVNREEKERREKFGQASVSYHQASSILTASKGAMGDFDFTLNPYSGCTFACSYCYAAFFTKTDEEQNNWGRWVRVKENALQLLIKYRKKPLYRKSIYMSSVTDPYQPIERELELTRSLLQEFIKYHDIRLVIQTRSPLVARDIELFKQFRDIQVNMSVTTDTEEVRKVFEPVCSSIEMRLKAIRQVREAGINACISLAPLLPIHNAEQFADRLLDTGIQKYYLNSFHMNNSKFVSGTREGAIKLVNDLGWNDYKLNKTVVTLKERLPELRVGGC